MRRLLTTIAVLTVFAAMAPALSLAGSPRTTFGIADDGAKYAGDGGSSFFSVLRDVGFDTNRISVTWDPTDGSHGLTIRERGFLDSVIPIAAVRGVEVVLDVYPLRAKAFAVDTQARIDRFAQYLQVLARAYPTVKKFIVGNEPNQPRFNQPQFARKGRGGYRATAGALYERVLAAGYDALKEVDPKITVVGLGLSPRGNDDPRAKNNISRSPVRFLRDFALAYRASGRGRPLMDEFGFHPYPNSNSDPLARGYSWPNAGIPNLDRIKQAIWDGFHDTAQPVFAEPAGSDPLPELGGSLGLELDEYGRQVRVTSSKASLYKGRENVRTISEARQASMYAAIVRQVACDPNVKGFFFFHLIDELDLDRFQSGLLRADGSKRPSYAAVKGALEATHGQCTGSIRLWRHATTVIGADVTFAAEGLTVAAAEDVTVTAGIFPAVLSTARIVDALSGRRTTGVSPNTLVRAYHSRALPLSLRGLPRGSYVQAAILRAAMNPERTFLAVGDPISHSP